MKVLVTGHKGFIASNFLQSCPSEWEVVTYDWKDGPIEMFVDSLEGFDWVVHMGAISSTTETNIDKIMDVNVKFTINLFEECIKHNVNFQWSSSASVYGTSASAFREVNEVRPANLYAMSKYLIEEYITKRDPKNIIYQGFRYFNVFGPGEDHKGDQASPMYKFEKQAKETGVIKLFENSDSYKRDFVHVDKVIDVHKRMMKVKNSGIWNVGTGHAISFQTVAKKIAERYNAQIEYIPMPEELKAHYQRYTCADTTKLDNILKALSYQEILERI
jgi:ADP-L-glycero-D-manno-heptose 6-epimerase